MDLFKKNRLTLWTIVVLVVLNLATLTTLWLILFRQEMVLLQL